MKKFIYLSLCLFSVVILVGCSGAYIGDSYYGSYEEYLEEYHSIVENEYKDVESNPLSSFSLDSSTYAYSNLRRLIKNNAYIDSDAVVIEQMLNYFNYSYVNNTDNALATILELDICPWNNEHYLASIAVKAKDYDMDNKKNNFVFLVDISGSMSSDNKLSLFKQGFKLLMDEVDEDDTISIVTYASGVNVLAEGINGANKEELVDAIMDLDAGGSTNGSGGIQKAYRLAEKYFIKDGNNRVLLATDGDFNVGPSTDMELEWLISSKRNKGIYLKHFVSFLLFVCFAVILF